MEQFDLVDEMQWEDSDKIEWVSLEAAGLEMREWDTVCKVQSVYFNEEI